MHASNERRHVSSLKRLGEQIAPTLKVSGLRSVQFEAGNMPNRASWGNQASAGSRRRFSRLAPFRGLRLHSRGRWQTAGQRWWAYAPSTRSSMTTLTATSLNVPSAITAPAPNESAVVGGPLSAGTAARWFWFFVGAHVLGWT